MLKWQPPTDDLTPLTQHDGDSKEEDESIVAYKIVYGPLEDDGSLSELVVSGKVTEYDMTEHVPCKAAVKCMVNGVLKSTVSEYVEVNPAKRFKYVSDFDENGICYYVGPRAGTKPWQNPAKLGLIKIKANGFSYSSDWCFVERAQHNAWTKDGRDSWISIDFGDKMLIRPTAYSLRQATGWKGNHEMRNWELMGSNNGMDWSAIIRHENCQDLKNAGNMETATWRIENFSSSFQMFKIQMTGPNSSGSWEFTTSGFEIYGFLFEQ